MAWVIRWRTLCALPEPEAADASFGTIGGRVVDPATAGGCLREGVDPGGADMVGAVGRGVARIGEEACEWPRVPTSSKGCGGLLLSATPDQ